MMMVVQQMRLGRRNTCAALLRSPRAAARILLLLPLLATGGTSLAQIASLQPTLSLQTVDNCTVPFQNGIPLPSFEKQRRPLVSLSGAWRKQRFSADHALTLAGRDSATRAALIAEAAGRHSVSFDDTAWPLKDIPGVENAMNIYETTPEYYEDGVWYRRAFHVPDSLHGMTATLKFLAVNYVADVWLNGTYLGWHEGGYTPFAFDVTIALRYDTVNVIAVRVDNIPWNPTQTQDLSQGRRIDIVPYYKVDWFNYTGIIHDVDIEFSPAVSVIRADAVPLNIQGDVRTTIVVRNAGPVDQTVDVNLEVFAAAIDSTNIATEYSLELAGAPVSVIGTAQSTLTVQKDSCRAWQTIISIPSPKLWSPRHPDLYILRASLSRSGVTMDEFSTQFGLRTVSTSGSTFLLNDRPMYLTGIARHEDHPLYGRSVPKDVIVDDLSRIKALNISLVRTAHYPNDPYTYLIADRLGLAVMEEIPVWWFDTDNAWLIQNAMRHIHTQMWREMVFKDYNRPSVILWSTCNECMVVAGRQTFITSVHNELDTSYPDGRLVTQSAAADRPGPGDASQAACDVAGWTMYFGIFHGGTYYAGTKQFLQDAHAAYPVKPIVNTEFGYWSTESGSEEWKQVRVFDSTFMALSEVTTRDGQGGVRPGGFLMGTTWWCAFDWYTSQQPAGFQSMGIFHMDRMTSKQVTGDLVSTYGPYYLNSETTGIDGKRTDGPPVAFRLEQNFPNPFNPSTEIGYRVQGTGYRVVTLKVYDILGREVATLVNDAMQAGRYTVRFDAGNLASGVYFYRLVAGTYRETKKMIVAK